MKISIRTRKLEKQLNLENALKKAYGTKTANKIKARLAVLEAAETLGDVPTQPPERLHLLRGDRKEQFAVDLDHPRRLVLEPDHDPIPRREDGGIDRSRVTAITILEITDYH